MYCIIPACRELKVQYTQLVPYLTQHSYSNYTRVLWVLYGVCLGEMLAPLSYTRIVGVCLGEKLAPL